MKDNLIDTRRAIRIKGKFSFQLGQGKSLIVGKTVDLSQKGMCCEIRGRVPIFKEIEIQLQLPESMGKKVELICKGVVVRCQKASKKGVHRIAFYFTEFDPVSEEKLLGFIKAHQFSEAA